MNSPAPILMLTHRLDLGGSERQMTEVAKAISRERFEPHVGCFHSEGIRGDELRQAGVPILTLPVTSFASPSALWGGISLIKYIRSHGIRLVHSFDVPLNIFSVPFARLSSGPAVLSSQRAHRNLTPGLYTNLLRITDQMVDGIVVNCLHMRDHLVADERVPAELIHLCYNGMDLTHLSPEGPRATMPNPAPDGGIVIGVICALRPEKGLLTLVQAISLISDVMPAPRLLIVGDGPMLAALEAEAEKLGVLPLCNFVSKTKEVAPWLRVIDIFVLPSLSEAFSNSLMEAMACECCCVASEVGGSPELIAHGERGFLFPKADAPALAEALRTLIANPEKRRAMAAAGREFIVNGFGLDRSVRRMEEIYTTFLR